MSIETIDSVVRSLKQVAEKQSSPFCIVLHGGEPLLIGHKRLSYLFRSLRTSLSHSFPISIQTNGILITDSILDLCSRYRVSIAVSIDGPKYVNDLSRIDHRGKGTFDRVIRGIHKLSNHEDAVFLYAGLLAVIDTQYSPQEVYAFFKRIGAPSVDFLYRDGNHSRLPIGKSRASSIEYGKWMLELASFYVNDPHPVPIRVLDDMIKVLLGGIATKEGMGITDYGIAIIDTDGSITKNDTLKSSGSSADQFDTSWNVKRNTLLELLRSDEFARYHEKQKSTCRECLDCPYLNICGGGMLTHRWSEENDYDNPTVYCADQQYLVDGLRTLLNQHGLLQ